MKKAFIEQAKRSILRFNTVYSKISSGFSEGRAKVEEVISACRDIAEEEATVIRYMLQSVGDLIESGILNSEKNVVKLVDILAKTKVFTLVASEMDRSGWTFSDIKDATWLLGLNIFSLAASTKAATELYGSSKDIYESIASMEQFSFIANYPSIEEAICLAAAAIGAGMIVAKVRAVLPSKSGVSGVAPTDVLELTDRLLILKVPGFRFISEKVDEMIDRVVTPYLVDLNIIAKSQHQLDMSSKGIRV